MVSRQNVIGIRTKCQKTKCVITRTLTLILGHTLTVTGPLPQWRSKGGPPRAAKLRLYLRFWKSILKGRNFRKGYKRAVDERKIERIQKKIVKKILGYEAKISRGGRHPSYATALPSLPLSLSPYTHPLSLDLYTHKHSLSLYTLTLYLSTHSLYLTTTHSLDLSFSLHTHTLSLLLSEHTFYLSFCLYTSSPYISLHTRYLSLSLHTQTLYTSSQSLSPHTLSITYSLYTHKRTHSLSLYIQTLSL